jgi:3-oxoacyl-[acyl-carrier-protein] synthase-3
MVNTSDEWITTRTGIKERRIADENMPASDIAVCAARRALETAGLKPTEIDLLVTATVTGDYHFPSTACIIQRKLGIKNIPACDINAACSGFIYGLDIAQQYIVSGKYKNVLVIGTEKMSSVIDWSDRNVCVLLGDGAGAAVVGETKAGRGIIGTEISSDGELANLIMVPAGGSAKPATEDTVKNRLHYMKMEGKDVYKHAVLVMYRTCSEILKKYNFTTDDINWFVPHQANMRIIEAVADRLKLPLNRVYTNLQRYGNMSAASIPVALDEAIKDGSIKKGDNVLLIAFGAGLTWGASILEI